MQNAYALGIYELLQANRNESLAPDMEKYMRGLFPFLGLKSPQRVQIVRDYLKQNGLPPLANLSAVCTDLWNTPEREAHYTALDLLEKQVKKLTPDYLPLLEWLITHQSWWDTVDLIATRLVGVLLQKYPQHIPAYTLKWIESPNMWLNRTAILFQLKYKSNTDEALLFNYITRCAASKAFFIQKAIGWALREYSYTNALAVQQFIAHTPLAPLSIREGLKGINKRRGKEKEGG